MSTPDLDRRLDRMSPQRRKLLDRLLAEKSGAAMPAGAVPAARAGNEMVGVLHKARSRTGDGYGQLERGDYLDKALVQQNYGTYHDELRASVFGKQSFFMNLGYVADGSPQYSRFQIPPRATHSRFIQLALETIGDCELDGRRVLDIGCGRGGTVFILNEYFEPAEVVGLDLTAEAVEFCCQTHIREHTSFVVGDAENLQFDDLSFDVVTNIESSHHYPNVGDFYRGVYRVLAPGGHFLYATLLPSARFVEDLEMLSGLGFTLEKNIDITANVLASCDSNRSALFDGVDSQGADAGIANAIGLPGSQVYEDMRRRVTAYRILRLCKAG